MASLVTIVTGPPQCGKTARLLGRYRELLAENRPGAGLWLAPTQRSAAAVRDRLLAADFTACASPNTATFDLLGQQILRSAGVGGERITPLAKRHLVARLIEQHAAAGKLKHFARIAGTPGLLDLVCEWITELKRLEIWPHDFLAACESRTLQAKDRELLALYEAYQHALTAHDLFDPQGRFWAAREQLKAGLPPALAGLRTIVVDGFTDFTRTQYEMLELLAGHVGELWISLPLEEKTTGPDLFTQTIDVRGDLFAKTLDTLSHLQRRFPAAKHERIARRRRDWPAMAHLEEQLFRDPREQQIARNHDRIEILPATQERGELELVGRRIKELLVTGDKPQGRPKVPPGEIAVVFRSLSRSAPLVREVFTDLGIPFALEEGQSLSESSVLRALANLLRLAVEDWPFRGLLSVITSNYFRPSWTNWGDHVRRSAELLIHRLQVPQGRASLLARVTHRAAAADEESGSSESTEPPDESESPAAAMEQRRSEQDRHAAATAPVLTGLAEALDALPAAGTFAQWSAALEKLAASTGLLAVPAGFDSESLARDRDAWQRLLAALAALDELYTRLGDRQTWKLPAFVAAVEDILQSESLPAAHDETGRVRVLAAASARGLQIPYLFCAGLSEQAFPPADRADRLYSDHEVRQLTTAGLPLVHRQMRGQEEMLLFYDLVNRATVRLFFSYPALDARAQPLLPSPYLSELQQLFEPLKELPAPDLTPIPDQVPASAAEWRIKAVADAVQHDDTALLAGWKTAADHKAVAANLLAGLELTHERKNREEFGIYEGIIPGERANRWLYRRFAQRAWSPGQLELYQQCPFRFFLQSVLGLEPLEEVELETDLAHRGVLLHETMVALHRRILADGVGTPSSHERFVELFAEALAETAAEFGSEADSLTRTLTEIDRRILSAWAQSYYEQHVKYDSLSQGFEEPLAPAHFEVAFGPQRGSRNNDDPLSTAEPFVLERAGEQLLIAGRIDRIDLGRVAGRVLFNVVDYKSGNPARHTSHHVEQGKALQLPLYAMAVAEKLLVGEEAVPWQLGYWFPHHKGFKHVATAHEPKQGNVAVSEAWEELRQQTTDRVFQIVEDIELGRFPVFNEDEGCTSFCPFRTVCRINQVRSLEKQWPPSEPND